MIGLSESIARMRAWQRLESEDFRAGDLDAVLSAAESVADRQLEYGWEWVSGINSGTFPIHGSGSKESAERAMADTGNRIAPVRIMVREKAVAGPWREA